ncbi:MAG: DUF465 domain-containing protein [Deferribacteraceae bacterium]|jgi:uncharacterized protein YdcH (DUF465 family)|nr:DUF465 domain-containing protein [Deferribacteraceae bacterium]
MQTDLDIVDYLAANNTDFHTLLDQHILLEQDLEALYSLKYFPVAVEARIKEIKKSKLQLKDQMQVYIKEYKNS